MALVTSTNEPDAVAYALDSAGLMSDLNATTESLARLSTPGAGGFVGWT